MSKGYRSFQCRPLPIGNIAQFVVNDQSLSDDNVFFQCHDRVNVKQYLCTYMDLVNANGFFNRFDLQSSRSTLNQYRQSVESWKTFTICCTVRPHFILRLFNFTVIVVVEEGEEEKEGAKGSFFSSERSFTDRDAFRKPLCIG